MNSHTRRNFQKQFVDFMKIVNFHRTADLWILIVNERERTVCSYQYEYLVKKFHKLITTLTTALYIETPTWDQLCWFILRTHHSPLIFLEIILLLTCINRGCLKANVSKWRAFEVSAHMIVAMANNVWLYKPVINLMS